VYLYLLYLNIVRLGEAVLKDGMPSISPDDGKRRVEYYGVLREEV
jgi:hypothetical protein